MKSTDIFFLEPMPEAKMAHVHQRQNTWWMLAPVSAAIVDRGGDSERRAGTTTTEQISSAAMVLTPWGDDFTCRLSHDDRKGETSKRGPSRRLRESACGADVVLLCCPAKVKHKHTKPTDLMVL